MRAPKNTLQKPNIVPVGNKNVQKGNSTPRGKKTRSTARYVEVEIRIPRDEFDRGLPYFEQEKYLGRFVLDAFREKINRAEVHDKAGRLRKLLTDERTVIHGIKTHARNRETEFSLYGLTGEGNRNG